MLHIYIYHRLEEITPKYPVKFPFPPIKKVPNAPEYPIFSMLSK